MALSTANLYAGGQPGDPLFGMLTSDPVNGAALHAGKPSQYGTASDPLIGKHIGGVIVFGGGRALYSDKGIVGALGAGGDTSCADHNIAWRIRKAVGLNKVPAGVAGTKKDAIIYDIGADGKSLSGYGHPTCGIQGPAIAADLGAGVVPNGVKEESETCGPPASGTSRAGRAPRWRDAAPAFQNIVLRWNRPKIAKFRR
jgi:hypothetical protein